MNKIHEKKPNQLVFDYKYSDIGIIPTIKELTQDEIYKKYIRRSLTWFKYIQKGNKWKLNGYINMRLKLDCILINTIMVLLNQKYHGNRKELNNEIIQKFTNVRWWWFKVISVY